VVYNRDGKSVNFRSILKCFEISLLMHKSTKQANAKLCGRCAFASYVIAVVHRKFVSVETEHKISLCTIYMRYIQGLEKIMETLQILYTFPY
jgi:hypothetical protein